MNNNHHGMTYICKQCGHQMSTSIQSPVQWTADYDPAYWHLCECCGCFSVPMWIADYMGTEEAICKKFSRCPNAFVCRIYDQYAGDCEHGQVMQKCFVAVHEGFAHQTELLKTVLSRVPRRRK